MWAIGRYDLRLSDKEFWALTPRQFFALIEQKNIAEARADYRAGTIASTLVNINLKEGATPLKPEDFFFSVKKYLTTIDLDNTHTWEDDLRMVELLNTVFEGTDQRVR